MSSSLLKIAALGCILAVVAAGSTREKRQLFADSFGSSVVDPYVDQPFFGAAPRVVYRRPTVVVQRPSYYPELYSQPLVRAYRPMYRQVVPQVYAEPQPLIIQRRPSFAVAAPVPYMAHSALASDILIKKKKLASRKSASKKGRRSASKQSKRVVSSKARSEASRRDKLDKSRVVMKGGHALRMVPSRMNRPAVLWKRKPKPIKSMAPIVYAEGCRCGGH